MSTSKKEGKDMIIFATAEDHKKPGNDKYSEIEPPNLELGDENINWDCPCLENMLKSPCGQEFKEAFTCFRRSETDPKGTDCYNAFCEMTLCMAEYPEIYKTSQNYDEDDNIDMELTDEEKALISEDSVTEASESHKVGGFQKVEDKPADKKSSAPTGQKSPPKSSTPATGTLKINM